MFSGFQSNAFQSNAFQIIRNAVSIVGSSGNEKYTYATPYQILQSPQAQRDKIKAVKTDLARVDSVLEETTRKKLLAEESRKLAKQRNALKRSIELEALEREYLNEINRLLMVRADLIRRIRADEEILVVMIMARKRRFRFAA